MIEELSVDFNSIVRAGDVIMRLDPSLFETQVAQARANLIRAEADTERLRVSLDDVRVAAQARGGSRGQAADLRDRAGSGPGGSTLDRSATKVIGSRDHAGHGLTQSERGQPPTHGSSERRSMASCFRGWSMLARPWRPVFRPLNCSSSLPTSRRCGSLPTSTNRTWGGFDPTSASPLRSDAFPGEEFEGTVSQVRLEPVVTQNVVTYATVVDAPNPDLLLKPGMTATIALETARRENVLRVPNAALRFRPTNEMYAVLGQSAPESSRAAGSASAAAPSGGDRR